MPTVFDLHVPIKALISPVTCFLGEIQKVALIPSPDEVNPIRMTYAMNIIWVYIQIMETMESMNIK